ncbi:MAG: hypothetical protein NPMRD1_60025 [Nitrosopumilales archaeon]|nr:MAG: hypothetical protein NPMRD1_60025 [Nitrosopumilales archaeon]
MIFVRIKIQATTNPNATIALIPEERIWSNSPYPEIEIGAKIKIEIPPPRIIKIHMTKMNV